MIVLDTHIWVWWVHGHERLTSGYMQQLAELEPHGFGVSIISCWEVAKLVELGRLELQRSVEDWLDHALAYPGIELLQLTPSIVVESTKLPGNFHRDPADQIIVATARLLKCKLATADRCILQYPHIDTVDFLS